MATKAPKIAETPSVTLTKIKPTKVVKKPAATKTPATKKPVVKKPVVKTPKVATKKPAVKKPAVAIKNPKVVKPASKTRPAKPKAAIIHFVLDRSGSMAGNTWIEAIGGTNTFISEQKEVPGKATFSLSVFDDHYDRIYDNVDIKDVTPLSAGNTSYAPRGGTALYDAVGKTLNDELARKAPKSTLRIIAIQTDGQENASKEHNQTSIKLLVEKTKALGWQVLFLGANLDVAKFSMDAGFSPTATAAYNTNLAGSTTRALNTLSFSTTSYRNQGGGSIDYAAAIAKADTEAEAKAKAKLTVTK